MVSIIIVPVLSTCTCVRVLVYIHICMYVLIILQAAQLAIDLLCEAWAMR